MGQTTIWQYQNLVGKPKTWVIVNVYQFVVLLFFFHKPNHFVSF